MAKATFVWDEEDIAHVAAHGLTTAEIEPVVSNPRNVQTFSRSSGRATTFGMTKTSRYIAMVYEDIKEKPWTVRVVTAYDVPRPPGVEP